MTTVAPHAGQRVPTRVRIPDRALPWLGVLGALLLFEVLPRTGMLASNHFPPTSRILTTLAGQLAEASFWTASLNTLEGWALGLGFAAAAAIPLGLPSGPSGCCTAR